MAAMIVSDFDSAHEIARWQEVSDSTEREPGESAASLTFRQELSGSRAVLLAHLNPQPNGAAFVSFVKQLSLDLKTVNHVALDLTNLGDASIWLQCVLTTKASKAQSFQYQSSFEMQADTHATTQLPLDSFVAQKWGSPVPNAPDLISSELVSIGIRIVGRPQADIRQAGFYGIGLTTLSFE